MPTYEKDDTFRHDYRRLTAAEQSAFRDAVQKFVHDMKAGEVRKRLRIKGVRGHPGVWEMTWASDGRATFNYGTSLRPGDHHVVWRRVGSHDIFDNP